MSSAVGTVVLAGAGATLIMDLWALLARRWLRMPSADYCLVGRWLGHMPQGRFRHSSSARAARTKGECALGWGFHYGVGIAYAFVLVLPSGGAWYQQPTWLPALLLGLGSLIMPWGVMQPAFGLGLAASRAANPGAARLRSLLSHLAYALGLYAAASLLRLVPTLSV